MLHEAVIVVSIATDPTPRVFPVRRADVRDYGHGVHRVVLHYGFLEQPNVPEGLTEGAAGRLGVLREETTYFLGAESLVVTKRPGMALWRERLFAVLNRNATPASSYFGLSPESTMVVGQQVEL